MGLTFDSLSHLKIVLQNSPRLVKPHDPIFSASGRAHLAITILQHVMAMGTLLYRPVIYVLALRFTVVAGGCSGCFYHPVLHTIFASGRGQVCLTFAPSGRFEPVRAACWVCEVSVIGIFDMGRLSQLMGPLRTGQSYNLFGRIKSLELRLQEPSVFLFVKITVLLTDIWASTDTTINTSLTLAIIIDTSKITGPIEL